MEIFVEEIPYRETRRYVKKVTRAWGIYRRRYGQEKRARYLPLTYRRDAVPGTVEF